ncbi:hypothetical protein BHE74_00039990 [Ensete ventricosum]|nr:hypothetical protein BHE74_00039990 [Ensete ventricosum]
MFSSQNPLTFLFARSSHLRSSGPNAGFWRADRWFLFPAVKNLQKAKLPQKLPEHGKGDVRTYRGWVGVELRCGLDLFSSECASSPTSVGYQLSSDDDCYKTIRSRAEVSARPVLVRVRKFTNVGGGRNFLRGLMLPRESSTQSSVGLPLGSSRGWRSYTKGLFGDGRGDPERPLRCPTAATWGEGMTRYATLMGMG